MSTITLVLNDEQIGKLKSLFASEIVSKTPPYALFQIRTENCVITVYESKKAVFQGNDAEIYASSFQPKNSDYYAHVGSDEVGTGDYFGPVCVCATYVDETYADILDKLNICDSKQLSDEDIMKIAPVLMENIPYSLLVCDNARYNKVHAIHNMNGVKAMLHNQALVNLSKKIAMPQLIVIDQFTPEKSYYHYIRSAEQIVDHIHFETKAENKFPAVACGSIIARYAFLVSLDSLNRHYDFTFVKGAGAQVDECAARFIRQFGEKELGNVAKLHFKNTAKALSLID